MLEYDPTIGLAEPAPRLPLPPHVVRASDRWTLQRAVVQAAFDISDPSWAYVRFIGCKQFCSLAERSWEAPQAWGAAGLVGRYRALKTPAELTQVLRALIAAAHHVVVIERIPPMQRDIVKGMIEEVVADGHRVIVGDLEGSI